MAIKNPVLDCIADRRSIRSYTAEPLTEDEVQALVKSALDSPSARNNQPWHFTVCKDKALMDAINEEAQVQLGNDKREDRSKIFYDAPLAIFISCKPDTHWAINDCGIAVQNLALAAHSMGLGSVILGLPEWAFKGAKAADFEKALKFPEGYKLAITIAIGHPAASKDAHPVKDDLVDFV
jgi:nitroreductase